MRRFLSSTVPIVLAVVSGFLRQAHAMPPTVLVEGRPDRAAREGTPRDDPFASTIAVSSVSGSTTGSCLGVMVAPRIALTAGHCVSASAKITVHAATVGGSTKVVAVDRYWFDPTTDSSDGMVDMDSSDVAILVLAEPLSMPVYARYARRPLEHAADATGIRNREKVIEAMEITLRRATARYYASARFSAPGDSGSPVFVGNGEDRVVVGVLAGSSPRRTVFARVDLVADKVDELVFSTAAIPAGPRKSPAVSKPAPPRPPPPPSKPTSPAPPLNVRWT